MEKVVIALIFLLSCVSHAEKEWFQNICAGKEKVAKIRLYLQDVVGGPNPTLYEVARSSISNTPSKFGLVRVMDELVTAGPDYNSEKVGRFQGIITNADLETTAFAMSLNFVFTAGKYNGSTISVLGRNQLHADVRELPIVGGTGVFRFARGYIITTTHFHDAEAHYGVYEYTLYVTYVDHSNTADDIVTA